MANAQMTAEAVVNDTNLATTDFKLEVVTVPVSDVERAKNFYAGLGWRLDADFQLAEGRRLVQMTPPGSPTSIHFGTDLKASAAGTVHSTYLVVDDIELARAQLIRRGANVSDVFHLDDNFQPAGGRDPQRQSYRSLAMFSDPDGNTWMLQEVTTRLPGRGFSSDAATLTDLLVEAEKRHGDYESMSPKHHWSGWYASYIVARERGMTADGAANAAAAFIESSRP
jgi:catechol 2,3-dioxygenase-like lactoylglutathione lyase family enzyme